MFLSGLEVRCTTPTVDVPPLSSAARHDDDTPLLVGYDQTTVADHVGRISRTLANYAGPDHLAELNIVLSQHVSHLDPNLRRAMTFGVIAAAQEASRFGLIVMAASG